MDLEKGTFLLNHAESDLALTRFCEEQRGGCTLRPAALIKPRSVNEIKEVIDWAISTGTPLIPVSSSGPHDHGGTRPTAANAVVVDLSGMNRILSINKTFRMAVIEPGVTYGQLSAALAEQGMAPYMPAAPRAGKSVLASLMDAEPVMTPSCAFNNLDPWRCTQVVWGDGTIMGTGEANSPRPLPELQADGAWQINPRGPVLLDYYRLLAQSQGTMGIASWMSVHCALLPTRHEMYLVPAGRLEDLVPFVRDVTRLRLGEEILLLNGARAAALLGGDAEEIRALRDRLPAWIAAVGITAGELLPEERFAQQTEDVRDLAQKYSLELMGSVGGVSGNRLLAAVTTPVEGGSYKARARGDFRDIFFVTELRCAPELAARMDALAAAAGYPVSELQIYIQPKYQGVNYHMEFTLPFDPARPSKALELYRSAGPVLANAGAFYSRPYDEWGRLQLNRDAETSRIQHKIKNIFDPAGIMNPGKIFLPGEKGVRTVCR